MDAFLESMSAIFAFLFSQLAAFSTFLLESVLGQIIMAGLLISIIVFIISVIFSLGHKK